MSTDRQQQEAIEKVVTALANHGVVARSMGTGVFLSLAVAKNLVAILEDLKRIEERGHV